MDFEALDRLGRLRASGAVTDAEFEIEKARILGPSFGRADMAPKEAIEAPFANVEPFSEHAGEEPAKKQKSYLPLVALVLVVVFGFAGYRFMSRNSRTPTYTATANGIYKLKSEIIGIYVAPTRKFAATISANPHDSDASCQSYEKTPDSTAGKKIAAEGWHVTSELPIGNMDTISFVGSCTQDSNVTRPVDGNVALFQRDELVAVIYGKGVGYTVRSADPMQLNMVDRANNAIMGKISVDRKSITIRK